MSESTTIAQSGPTKEEVLFGGTDVTVIKKDGTAEKVKVAIVDIDEFPQLMSVLNDERGRIAIYCRKTPEWAKSLTMESHQLLIETGDRLNNDFFWPWVRRQMAVLNRLRPGLVEKLVDEAMSTLPTGLLKSCLLYTSPSPRDRG